MKKPVRSIQFRISLVTVFFTLTLTIVFVSLSFYFFRGYARASVLRASEFNMQLVANLVQQDLVELNSISSQLALNTSIMDCLEGNASKRELLDCHNIMTELCSSSSSYIYLQRLLVTNQQDVFLQVATSSANSTPVNVYNYAELPGTAILGESVWQEIVPDPLARPQTSDNLLIVRPVFRFRTNEQVGTIYLTASSSIITKRLSSYQSTLGGTMYLQSPVGCWQIGSDALQATTLDYTVQHTDSGTARASNTLIQDVTLKNGDRYTLVSCPIGTTGLRLTHMIPYHLLFAGGSLLPSMFSILVPGVIVLGVCLYLYLNRFFMRRVILLRRRIARVADGNFSTDPSIEWEDELGDIGRGVNHMSRDIANLLEKLLADEKERQHLEYQMLQNQVNPHFIYNTLNSIRWMATLQGATGIAEMTTAFAHLLKSVSKGSRPLITLREELALLNDYCTIQQYRYGGAITIEIANISDESLCECLIPSFSLQPLAENAIFHGIEPKGGAGSVWLDIDQAENGDLIIAMQDDGVGMSAEAIENVFREKQPDTPQPKYRQIGVLNVHRRVQYAFGPQYGLTIHSELGKYTRVELRIPRRYAAPQEGEP